MILRGGAVPRSARTSHPGGFQFTLEAPVRVDLSRDIFGHMIEIGCD